MQSKKKFVYHYPTYEQPEQGIMSVEQPPPFKLPPVRLSNINRMDNIAEVIRKFNPSMYAPPEKKECPYCGSDLGEHH